MSECTSLAGVGVILPVTLQAKAWGQWDTARDGRVERAVPGVLRDEAEAVG